MYGKHKEIGKHVWKTCMEDTGTDRCPRIV
jgi:hypothetical protein